MNVQTASQWALVFGAFLTALGLFLTAYQMRKNNLATQGQFLLNFDQLADRYDEVYYVLREAFDSGTPLEDGRFSPAQLLKCKEYMGFLEHAEVLIKLGSIDSKVFDDLFGHRVRALASCPEVMSATLKLSPDAGPGSANFATG